MRKLAATIVLLGAFTVPAAALATPGDLDGSFSADGLESRDEPTRGSAVAVGDDNSVVVAGPGSELTGGEVRSYGPDGALAWSNPYSSVTPAALTTEPGGSFLLGGPTASGSARDFELVRIDPLTGFALPSLGGDGLVTTDFDGGDDRFTGVAVAPDGSIAAAGIVTGPEGDHLGVARYTAAGEPDGDFDLDGEWTAPQGGGFGVDASVLALADGSTIVAGAGPAPDGSGTGDLLILKLTEAGVLDATFGGGDGWLTIDVDGRDDARSLALLDGGSLAVGFQACAFGLHTSCDSAVARLTPGGALDPSFGSGGVVVGAAGEEVADGGSGRVLVGGSSQPREYFQRDFALGRLLPDGTQDPGFAGGGLVRADFGLTEDIALSLAIGPDGRPVLAGAVGANAHGIARFELAEGPPDVDADTILDADDRCPERYARHRKTGCPKVARELTLRKQGSKLEAKLKSELQPCAARQKVRLVRLKGKRSRVVARARTAKQGKARLGKQDSGRYRATVKPKVAPGLARCAKARSKVVRVPG